MSDSYKEIENINPDAIEAMTTWARDKTWAAVNAIKDLIKPGMVELEAVDVANKYLASQGVIQYWHKPHIRFGESTILGFHDKYLENITLKENDIFYIDIGPVWDNIEGDCGSTFMVGNNQDHRKIINDLQVVFKQVRDFWAQNNPSGVALQSFTEEVVKQKGYVLYPSYVKGHRLSEFSHFDYSRASLFDTDFTPAAERWVLEFQICHPSMKFGAFYEDLLI